MRNMEIVKVGITDGFGIMYQMLIFKAKNKNRSMLDFGAHNELTWLWNMQHRKC
jgi:hypothetical protein